MCILGVAHASQPLVFDYLVTGSEDLRPALVFHDGENTYVQPPDNVPTESITTKDAVAEQYGPYLLIKGLPKTFLLAAKIGKKTETVKIVYQGPPRPPIESQPSIRAPEVAPQKVTTLLSPVPTSTVSSAPSLIGTIQAPVPTGGCQAKISRKETAFLVGFEPGSSKVSQVMTSKIVAAIGNVADIESIYILAGQESQAQTRASALKMVAENTGVVSPKVHIGNETIGQYGTELRIIRAKSIPCESDGMRIETPHRGAVTVVAKADAHEILKRLADKLGMSLVVEGTQINLPISVSEVEKPLVLVLEHIGKTITPQADLIIRPSELVIRYRKGSKT